MLLEKSFYKEDKEDDRDAYGFFCQQGETAPIRFPEPKNLTHPLPSIATVNKDCLLGAPGVDTKRVLECTASTRRGVLFPGSIKHPRRKITKMGPHVTDSLEYHFGHVENAPQHRETIICDQKTRHF